MKSMGAQLVTFMRPGTRRRNIMTLVRFFVTLGLLIAVYSVLFHYLMLREGQLHSWVTGVYWTLTVMSTLGFGDITFHTDLGRLFSMVVLLTGTVFLLILLPFVIIEFVYAPWLRAQSASRAPRALPTKTRDHVLLACHETVARALMHRLDIYGVPHTMIVPTVDEALALHDDGVPAMVGAVDDPETWRQARAEHAALVVATASDPVNTNVAFTVREQTKDATIVATAGDPASVDILELAGSNHVLRLGAAMGSLLARRVTAGSAAASHVLTGCGDLRIAEAGVVGTILSQKTPRAAGLLDIAGLEVLGVWNTGVFRPLDPDHPIGPHGIVLLAGEACALRAFDEAFVANLPEPGPVLILGGGRVGRAAAYALAERGLTSRIVEREPSRVRPDLDTIVGNAAEREILDEAGIATASTVLVTPHDDDINVYLTLYARRLRPTVQILSRAARRRNVSTLYRAGADVVLSYTSMGASALFNRLGCAEITQVAEGLALVQMFAPPALRTSALDLAAVHRDTGVHIAAVVPQEGPMRLRPDRVRLRDDDRLLLVADTEAERRFVGRYGSPPRMMP
ncbi:MAG: NAD-binding protein [Acidobacteriota bacterium]